MSIKDVTELIQVVGGFFNAGNFAFLFFALLIAVCAMLFFLYRRTATRYEEQIDREREQMMTIISKYEQGQVSVIQAINELKLVLAKIEGKIF